MPYEGGSGTQNDPYLISTQTHFESIADNLNAYYELTADVNLNGNDVEIGDFEGVLDGKNFRVYNMSASRGQFGAGGLFTDIVGDAVIKNVVFENINISGAFNLAVLTVASGSPTISECVFKNCDITGGEDVGIAFSRVSSTATIERCAVINGSVTQQNDNVNAGARGFLIGSVQSDVTVNDCYVEGVSSSGDGINSGGGAVTGDIESGSSLTVSNVHVADTSIHAFDGDNMFGAINGALNNSGIYHDTSTTSISSSNSTGLTTSEMQGDSAETNMSSYNFSGVWLLQTGPDDYPELQYRVLVTETGTVIAEPVDLTGDYELEETVTSFIEWTERVVADTGNVEVETAVTNDGSTPPTSGSSEWSTATSGTEIADLGDGDNTTGQFLWTKITLSVDGVPGDVAVTSMDEAVSGKFGEEFFKTLNEVAGLNSTSTDEAVYLRTRNEQVGANDTATKTVGFVRSLAEGVGLAAALSSFTGYVRGLGEGVGANTTLSRDLSVERVFGEGVSASDTVESVSGYVRSVSQGVGVADAAVLAREYLETLTETVQTSDTLTESVLYVRNLPETITAQVSSTVLSIYDRLYSEGLNVVDNATDTVEYVKVQVEDLTVNDVATSIIVTPIIVSEGLGVSGSVSKTKDFIRTVSQATVLNAGVVREAVLNRAVSASVKIGDFVKRGFFVEAFESVGVDTTAQPLRSIFRTISEGVGLGTDFTIGQVFSRVVTDSVGAGSRVVDWFNSAAKAVGIVESDEDENTAVESDEVENTAVEIDESDRSAEETDTNL